MHFSSQQMDDYVVLCQISMPISWNKKRVKVSPKGQPKLTNCCTIMNMHYFVPNSVKKMKWSMLGFDVQHVGVDLQNNKRYTLLLDKPKPIKVSDMYTLVDS